jgi:integrase
MRQYYSRLKLFKAERRLAEIISDYGKESEGRLKKKAPTFDKGIEIYAQFKKGVVTDQYITNNVNILKLHFSPYIGTMFVDKIDLTALKTCMQRYLTTTQAGKAIKTYGGYNQVLIILHSFFQEMIDQKFRANKDNLIPDFESSQKKPKRFLPESRIDEFKAVVDEKYATYKSVCVRMGLYLGLRSIEIVKAKIGMINWETKKFQNWDTKGNECEDIPICDEMLDWFKKLIAEREAATGQKVKASDYIILDGDNKPAVRAFARYAMEIAGKSVLGHRLSSHDMRRTFIMTLYKNGVDPETIRKLARHKNIKTTYEYIHMSDDDKVEAIDTVFNKKQA